MTPEVVGDILRTVILILVIALVVQLFLAKRRVTEAFTAVEALHAELEQLRREKQLYRDELASARKDVVMLREDVQMHARDVADLRQVVLDRDVV